MMHLPRLSRPELRVRCAHAWKQLRVRRASRARANLNSSQRVTSAMLRVLNACMSARLRGARNLRRVRPRAKFEEGEAARVASELKSIEAKRADILYSVRALEGVTARDVADYFGLSRKEAAALLASEE